MAKDEQSTKSVGIPTLTRNVYSPRLLSQELAGVVKPDFIRKQVRCGALKGIYLGPRNILISKEAAEEWLKERASMDHRVASGFARKDHPLFGRARHGVQKTDRERGIESARRERRRARRAT